MNKIDLTYGGKLDTLINVVKKSKIDILYTIDGATGKPTTASLKTNGAMMITFNYQDLKKIIEGNDE